VPNARYDKDFVYNFYLGGKAVGKYYTPSKGKKTWKKLLANSDKQWKIGYSAIELATSWEDAKGFPASVDLHLH